MTHLGVTHWHFQQDPDYPQPSSNVNNATAIALKTADRYINPLPSSIARGDAGLVGIGEQGRLDPSWGASLSQSQRDSQNAYDFSRQTFRPETWKKTVGGGTAQDLADIIAKYGSGSTGNNNAYQLGLAELAYKKQNDASDRATALEALNFGRNKDARVLSGLEDYYDTGAYGTGFNKLLKMITDQGTISETGVTNAYGRAKTNLDEGFTAAQGLGDTGYAALNKYLLQNPNNPYAGMKATVGGSPDAMSNYLKAYGVSDTPVQGQIQADQLQAQQGAGNYQNLIDVLGAVAKQGASSRGAESAMGQNLFNTSLGQDKAGYQGQASNAQAEALAALQQQMFKARYGVENDRNALSNTLAMQIIAAGGKPKGDENTNDDWEEDASTRTYEGTGIDRIRKSIWRNGKLEEWRTEKAPEKTTATVVPPVVKKTPAGRYAPRAEY